MYERVTYENHNGERLEFGDGQGLYINENNLHNYAWSYTTTNDRIKKFYKSITKFSLPIVVACISDEDGVAIKNSLMEIAEKDIIAGEYGKLIIGDYYLSCYITESSKASYNKEKRFARVQLTVVTDIPKWTKEETYVFRATTVHLEGGIDYPYDFTFDYGTSPAVTLYNNNFIESNFKIIVYGVAGNVNLTIGENVYNINTPIAQGEYVVIDSREKKAYLVGVTGEKTNVFSLRNRDYDLFAKIPSGINAINRNGWVDVTLYQERSEPLWT